MSRVRSWMALAALLLSLLPSALWSGWRFTTPMPHGRQDFGAVYDGKGRIYVMGGNVFEVKPHKHTRCYREGIYSTLVYDMKKDRWEYLDPVPGTVWDDIFLYFDKDRGWGGTGRRSWWSGGRAKASPGSTCCRMSSRPLRSRPGTRT